MCVWQCSRMVLDIGNWILNYFTFTFKNIQNPVLEDIFNVLLSYTRESPLYWQFSIASAQQIWLS